MSEQEKALDSFVLILTRAEVEQVLDGLTQREMWGTADELANRIERLCGLTPEPPRDA